MREGVFCCGSVRVARIAFQACSFNHSDISPFKINNLQWQLNRGTGNCVRPPNVPRTLTGTRPALAAPSAFSIAPRRPRFAHPPRCAANGGSNRGDHRSRVCRRWALASLLAMKSSACNGSFQRRSRRETRSSPRSSASRTVACLARRLSAISRACSSLPLPPPPPTLVER
jgi:hypothetical protein